MHLVDRKIIQDKPRGSHPYSNMNTNISTQYKTIYISKTTQVQYDRI